MSKQSNGRKGLAMACIAVVAVLALAPQRAQAWWRGGVFIGVPPIVVGPPYYPPPYYPPPPPYYPPPPVVYAPPPTQYTPPASNLRCYAGGYVCPLEYAVPRGAACSCYGNGGQPVPGRVGG